MGGEAFDSVRTLSPASLTDFDSRLRAFVVFAAMAEAQSLAAANKRIGNILRQAGGTSQARSMPPSWHRRRT